MRLVAILAACLALLLPTIEAQEKTAWEKSEDFADCFKARSNKNLEAVKKLVADPPCFQQPFIKTVKEYLVISFFPSHYRNPLRECYYCQKIIAGSVQMYNFEHRPRIRRINDKMLSLPQSPLIPEYLKHPFPRAEKECHFESIGDLTASSGLFIYCTYHGSAQPIEEAR